MKLKSRVYSRISYVLIQGLASENLLDYCKSPGWLQIYWVIENLLDIQGLWSTNHLHICEYQGYSGQGLQSTNCIFVNICEHLWPMSRKSQRFLGLWRTNHLYICESQGYSGPESLFICKSHIYSGPKGARNSWFLYHLEILNLLDNLECPGYSGSMNCKSTGYSQLI